VTNVSIGDFSGSVVGAASVLAVGAAVVLRAWLKQRAARGVVPQGLPRVAPSLPPEGNHERRLSPWERLYRRRRGSAHALAPAPREPIEDSHRRGSALEKRTRLADLAIHGSGRNGVIR